MTYRLIGVIVASSLVAQCATRSLNRQTAEALRAEELAIYAAVPVPDGVYRSLDPGVSMPTLIRSAHVQYTPEAMHAKVRGILILRAVVDRNGAVTDVRILKPLEASLDLAASKALAQWQFKPGARSGEPVSAAVDVRIAFTMP